MEAVVLAGGMGRRLWPYTSEMPKPLVPIDDHPVLELLLRHLARGGVTRAHLAVSHLAHLIMAVIGDGRALGLEVRYHVEATPLSTVGPLAQIPNLPDNFLLVMGDILTDLPVNILMDQHRASGADLTIAVSPRSERVDYGVVESNADGSVTGFVEKPEHRYRVSCGVAACSQRLVSIIPAGQAYGFDELVLELLRQRRPVRVFEHAGFWMDIGRVDDYENARTNGAQIRSRLGL